MDHHCIDGEITHMLTITTKCVVAQKCLLTCSSQILWQVCYADVSKVSKRKNVN